MNPVGGIDLQGVQRLLIERSRRLLRDEHRAEIIKLSVGDDGWRRLRRHELQRRQRVALSDGANIIGFCFQYRAGIEDVDGPAPAKPLFL